MLLICVDLTTSGGSISLMHLCVRANSISVKLIPRCFVAPGLNNHSNNNHVPSYHLIPSFFSYNESTHRIQSVPIPSTSDAPVMLRLPSERTVHVFAGHSPWHVTRLREPKPRDQKSEQLSIDTPPILLMVQKSGNHQLR